MLRFANKLEKKIQATAVLLNLEDGVMERVRLLKLLYIADRESLSDRALPIIGGRVSALDNGPLHSEVYDLIKGEHPGEIEWRRWFQNDGYRIRMINDPGRLKLSPYEIEKLTEVCDRYRTIGTWELAEATHKFPEWVQFHVERSSRTIPAEALLMALALSDGSRLVK